MPGKTEPEPLHRETSWATYEAGVQMYRSLSLTTQSLLVAVGAIFFAADPLPGAPALLRVSPILIIFAAAMLATWWVFFQVIAARSRIADFYKFDLENRYDRSGRYVKRSARGQKDGLLVNDFASASKSGRKLRRFIDLDRSSRGEHGRTTAWGVTRKKLDVALPTLFTIIWVVIVIGSFFQVFGA